MKRYSSLAYLINNFLSLLLPALVPATLLTVFASRETVFDLFFKFATNINGFTIAGMIDFYKYFSSINYFWVSAWIVIAVIAVAFYGLIFSAIERHKRLKAGVSIRLTTLLRDSVPVSAMYALVNFVVFELAGLVLTGMLMILYRLFSGTVALFIIATILTLAVYIIYSFFFALLSVTIPSILIDGYSFRYAAGYSITLVHKKFKYVYRKTVGRFMLTYVLYCAVKILLDIYAPPLLHVLFFHLCRMMFYTFWLMYMPIVCLNNYYYLTNEKRNNYSFLMR